MTEGVFPPIVADVLILLSVALGIIALIAAALVLSTQKQLRSDVRKIAALERELAQLKREVAKLTAALAEGPAPVSEQPAQAPPGAKAAPEPVPVPSAGPALTPEERARQVNAAAQPSKGKQSARPQEVWAPLLMDFNSLAASMQVPRADEACEAFIANYHLQMLRTSPHKVQGNDGHLVPQYEVTETLADCTYWGWRLPDNLGRAVVLPNPLLGCDQTFYEEKGLKETFASNYEKGSYKTVEVKLPAMFRIEEGRWLIDQPGVIKVK